MDPRLQSSFIPKKPMIDGGSGFSSSSSSPEKSINIFFLIATILFILTAVTAGGLFFFNKYEEQSIASKLSDIAKQQAQYDSNSYKDFIRKDARLSTAASILKNHVSTSVLFNILGNLTVKNISFDNFKYSWSDPTASAPAAVSMSGLGKSFNAVSFQSDTFRGSSFMKNPIFTGVHLDDKGNVAFSVTSNIDQNTLLFSNNLPSSNNSSQNTGVMDIINTVDTSAATTTK